MQVKITILDCFNILLTISRLCYTVHMKITKLGHCALILEEDGVKILTDPGTYTIEQNKLVRGINIILITHEHGDHFHIESIQEIIKNNPTATVVSNSAVAKLLGEKDIACTIVGDTQSAEVNGIIIEGFGKDHAPIYGTIGLVENTGYMVAGKFYFPGDAYYAPGKPIEILALPVAGPWMKISEAIDFAKKVKPKNAFGVHDGMIVPSTNSFALTILKNFLKPDGIDYMVISNGESKDF
jgi:L-ascorbate metabolism protein UlaG (beta-lactamase superfamily)